MRKPLETVSADVLVLGGGAAGIRAALAAARRGASVAMVCAGQITRSGSTFSPHAAGWGMQALVGDERTEEALEEFYEEILEAGLGCCDPRLAEVLVLESGPRWEDLVSFGLGFVKGSDGNHIRVRGCFSRRERAFVARMPEIRKTLGLMARASGVSTLTGTVVELVTSNGRCWGAWILGKGDRWILAKAGATVLAMGGGAAIFQYHLAHDHQVGEGVAIAARAGAELSNMEFIQFMLGIEDGGEVRFLPLDRLGREGSLLDQDAGDLLAGSLPCQATKDRAIALRKAHYPFSCRDESVLVDLAVAKELREGAQVFWQEGGNGSSPPRVIVCCHAFNGGVMINEEGRTSLPGLFAAGEAAAGPHGADRVGGAMITATQVFGARSGESASREALQYRRFPSLNLRPPHTPGRASPGGNPAACRSIRERARRIISERLSILRDRPGLRLCLEELERLEQELRETRTGPADRESRFRTLALLETASHVARGALARTKSLGSHFRTDDPSFQAPTRHGP